MIRRRRVYAWVALVALVLVASCSGPKDAPLQNAILISWDGADRAVIHELIAAGKLPNLTALVAEGSLRDIEVVGHQTETGPGHAQMLTGVGPEVNLVRANSDYRPMPEGISIFERLQKHFRSVDAVRTIMVTSKVGYMGGEPPKEVYSLVKTHLTAFDADARRANKTGTICLDLLAKHHAPRFLAFFHFREPDRAGHEHGIDSAEYREGIVTCDEWLGQIVTWLKENNLYARTCIYVTADHGFNPHGHGHSNAPHVTLATNDSLVIRGGTQADVPATILARFGLDIDALEPKLIGTDLTKPAPAAVTAPALEPAEAN